MKLTLAAAATATLGATLGLGTKVLHKSPPPPVPQAAANSSVWATGKIEAWRQAVVSATGAGRIEEVLKRPGQDVSAGEPVVMLERGRLQAQLIRAQAAERQARRDRDRTVRLKAAKVSSDEDVEKAETTLSLAIADLKTSQAAMNDAVIRAPFAGRVLNAFREKGESVAPGTPLFAVGDVSALRARAQVDELDVGRAVTAKVARVWPDSWPGRSFPASVVSRNGMLGTRTQFAEDSQDRVDSKVLETEVRLDPSPELLPGMSVKVELQAGEPASSGK
jgi:RND family efflux transporter MFP subunit